MLAVFRLLRQFWRDDRASQLVEFAISLPLLVVMMVGIFDFSGAYNLKQKLSDVAGSTARLGADQPTADLSSTTAPASVQALHEYAAQYLTRAGLSDCGIGAAAATSAGPLSWSYSGTGCAGATATLKIERAFVYKTSDNMWMAATRVTFSYPYAWRFATIIKLVAPGATYAGIATLKTEAIAPNQT